MEFEQAVEKFRDAILEANRRSDTARVRELLLGLALLYSREGDSVAAIDPTKASRLRATARGLLDAAQNNESTGANGVVTFDDIKGEALNAAKREIYEKVIKPSQHPDVYRKYNLSVGSKMLLYGPPGTGKTMFAKAVSSQLGGKFIIVKSGSIIDSKIGKTEANIAKLFAEAREEAKKGVVVLFIDEIDKLARKRTGDSVTAEVAVPELLEQMDGISSDSTNLVILAATNFADEIDEAVLSRFQFKCEIPLPSAKDCAEILKGKIGKFARGLDYAALGERAEGLSGRDLDGISVDAKYRIASLEADGKSGEITQEMIERLIDGKRNDRAHNFDTITGIHDATFTDDSAADTLASEHEQLRKEYGKLLDALSAGNATDEEVAAASARAGQILTRARDVVSALRALIKR